MDEKRREEIDAIVVGAWKRPPEERVAYLDEACGSDTDLRLEVDHDTGKLTSTGQIIETGSPTCIVFKTQ